MNWLPCILVCLHFTIPNKYALPRSPAIIQVHCNPATPWNRVKLDDLPEAFQGHQTRKPRIYKHW